MNDIIDLNVGFKITGTGTLTDAVITEKAHDEVLNDQGQTVAEAVRFRKLATVRRIDDIQPIEGADKIVKARIGGWHVVTAKDNGFNVGDLVIYLEIDSWVPHTIAPFLSKGALPREYNGVKGERLKTIRLRGQLSQGLILPMAGFDAYFEGAGETLFKEGDDVTSFLGIQKWEPPESGSTGGQTKGSFPHFIRKTDQERIQNLLKEVFVDNIGEMFEVSMKLDGSSMTVYYFSEQVLGGEPDSRIGVCSRNQELRTDQEGNAFVDTVKKIGLDAALKTLGKNIAVQGELMGSGIQGNREGFNTFKFFVYDIYNIDEQCYHTPYERMEIMKQLKALCFDHVDFDHVPVLGTCTPYGLKAIDGDLNLQCQELLEFADGHSINHPVREGLVWKRIDGKFSFKTISNKFLEKGGN
jgi:RNA ligase (TIGR02306 family)